MTADNEVVLIDTSVWIASFRGKPANVTEITGTLLKEDRDLTCGPVLFEIRRGLRLHERKTIMPLMEAVIRLSLDEQDWELAGDLDASLRKRGITIPPIDSLIARVCLRHDVPLFTLDRHFNSVSDISLFKP